MQPARAFFLCSIAAMCFATAAMAQMPAYTQASPVPPALTTAKTVFVSNAGAQNYGRLRFSGDPDRAYTEFYAALKATGDYTLVADPAQADLVLELRLVSFGTFDSDGQYGTFNSDPEFRLVVYDTKSHYILWTITRPVGLTARTKAADKNFDSVLSDVLNQFLQITGKAPTAAH